MAEEVKGNMSFAQLFTQELSSTPEVTETSVDQSQEPTETEPSEPTEVADTQESPATKVEQKAVPREIEYAFTDKEGKKQKAKFDLSNTEKLQQELSLAAGARVWQRDRDMARKQLKELEEQHSEISKNYSTLEQAWGDGGREGLKNLVNLLTTDKEGFDKFLKSEVDRVRARESATPDELERMTLLEEKEAAVREREKAVKTLNQREEAAIKAKAEAEHAATRALIDPVFFEHSFDGKLGDAETEAELNEALWASATKKLDALPEGTVLTPAVVKDVFSKVASRLSAGVTKQVEAKTKEVATKRKEAAQTKVAAAGKQGSANIDLGNLEEAIKTKGFSSVFSSMFGG
jgi:hypothetical protein